MDKFSPRRPVSAEEARSIIQSICSTVRETITVPISEALNCVLAEDIVSPINVPVSNNSAMDGYAMNFDSLSEDGSGKLKLVGKSFAGHPFEGDLKKGECIRIMTGATVPLCCDTVIQQELTSADGDIITFLPGVLRGTNVRLCGEELALGKVAIEAGCRLTPPRIGLLATLGRPSVTVYRRPKVAVLSTGDELAEPGDELKTGQIYDSNSFSLEAILKSVNADVLRLKSAKDIPDSLINSLSNAVSADIILTSGGVSVGEADFTRFVISHKGQIFDWEIPMRPGRPMAVGTLAGKPLFCLPGNPVAAAVTFIEFGLAAVRKTAGETGDLLPPRVTAVAEGRFKKRSGRYEMQRGIFRINEKGVCVVKSTGMQSSAMLTSMCKGNCIVWLDRDRDTVSPGETVEIHPFFGLF